MAVAIATTVVAVAVRVVIRERVMEEGVATLEEEIAMVVAVGGGLVNVLLLQINF